MDLIETVCKLNQNAKAFIILMPMCKFVSLKKINLDEQIKRNSVENLETVVLRVMKQAV